jgi:hypothetical protein
MDRTQLEQHLASFRLSCQNAGYPVNDFCLTEAFPGVSGTSYIIDIQEDWIGTMSCSAALDILLGILWKTTSVDVRKKIFCFRLNTKDSLRNAS